jgi:adhesin transport system membrane fusion protein
MMTLHDQLFRHVRPFRGGGLSALMLIGLTLTFGALMAWAAWAELDEVARAPATVIAKSRSQVVQVFDGGILKELLVHEGEQVRKGDLLATLDAARANASVGEVQSRVLSLKAAIARTDAELSGKPLQFPDDVQKDKQLIANQTELMRKRQQAMREDLAAVEAALQLARREQSAYEKLLAMGDAGESEVFRAQRIASDLQAQITNKRNKYLQDVQAELTKAREDLSQLEKSLEQRDETLQATRIYAPADGLVKNIRITTLGGILRAGEELLQIVPTGDRLQMEARARPGDIAFIRPGLPVSIKLDTYDYTVYGSIRGTVAYVSPDSLREENGRQTDAAYYRLLVDLPPEVKTLKGRELNVLPGMTGTVEITTGHRTVAAYLLKPLRRGVSEALRER